MRLFTAITFTTEVMDQLYKNIVALKELSEGGTFTLKENLHLTLNFIGETGRSEEVKQAMQWAVERTGTESFQLTLSGFGIFKRREGDIYWIGVEKESSLWRLQRELADRLKEAGFPIEDREFKPHLTLGRRVRPGKGFDRKVFEEAVVPLSLRVDKISLMNSERIQGKLTYTEIYRVNLKDKE